MQFQKIRWRTGRPRQLRCPPNVYRQDLLRRLAVSWRMMDFTVRSTFLPKSVFLHSSGSASYMRKISPCRSITHFESAHSPLGLGSLSVPTRTWVYFDILSRQLSSSSLACAWDGMG